MSEPISKPHKPHDLSRARGADFAALYRDWLTARARLIDPDQPDDDETTDKLTDAYDAAERTLFETPADSSADILMKFEVLSHILDRGAEEGPMRLGLSSRKSDVVQLARNVT
jgi:hypothetical protein